MKLGLTAVHDDQVHSTWKRLFPVNWQLVQPSDDCRAILIVNRPCERDEEIVRQWAAQGKPLVVAQCEPNMHLWGNWANPWMLGPATVFEHTMESGNIMEWWLPYTCEQLATMQMPVKTKCTSMILSNKGFDPGHKIRLQTKDILQQMDGCVAECKCFELFGTCQGGQVLPPLDKRLGLEPFRYHVAAENHKEPNYVTEKLWDSILSGCCTFWWGGEQNMVNEDCFIRLTDDAQVNANLVKLCREADCYSDYKPRIEAERKRLLREQTMGSRVLRALAMY